MKMVSRLSFTIFSELSQQVLVASMHGTERSLVILLIATAYMVQDTVSEAPERFFIAEIVREQVFMLYQQEIPYSSTVREVIHQLC